MFSFEIEGNVKVSMPDGKAFLLMFPASVAAAFAAGWEYPVHFDGRLVDSAFAAEQELGNGQRIVDEIIGTGYDDALAAAGWDVPAPEPTPEPTPEELLRQSVIEAARAAAGERPLFLVRPDVARNKPGQFDAISWTVHENPYLPKHLWEYATPVAAFDTGEGWKVFGLRDGEIISRIVERLPLPYRLGGPASSFDPNIARVESADGMGTRRATSTQQAPDGWMLEGAII